MHERADRLAGSFVTVDDEPRARVRSPARRVVDPGVPRGVQRAPAARGRRGRRSRGLRQGVSKLSAAARPRAVSCLARADDVADGARSAARQSPALAREARETSSRRDVETGLSRRRSAVARSERAEQLWRAIDALPEKLRLVIVLAGIEGHDIREVAALLDVPEGTVKSRLFLARKQLKERLSWMATDTRPGDDSRSIARSSRCSPSSRRRSSSRACGRGWRRSRSRAAWRWSWTFAIAGAWRCVIVAVMVWPSASAGRLRVEHRAERRRSRKRSAPPRQLPAAAAAHRSGQRRSRRG